MEMLVQGWRNRAAFVTVEMNAIVMRFFIFLLMYLTIHLGCGTNHFHFPCESHRRKVFAALLRGRAAAVL